MRTTTIQIEWHLTPRGWVNGDWSAQGPLTPRSSPPEDRVETWVKSEVCQPTTFVPLEIKWSLVWASPHHSEIDRKVLRAKIRTVVVGPNNPSEVYGEFPLE
ncbi:MAG: hypothetical protein NDI90_08280 [Nitrospira sp. BO4]|nr:hypothetical protein [Nitrospira sp. BO4]